MVNTYRQRLLLKSLAGKTRFKLLKKILSESELFDSNETSPLALNHGHGLESHFGLAKSTVSHHVSNLIKSTVLRQKRIGRFIFLFPNTKAIEKLRQLNMIHSDFPRTPELIEIKKYAGKVEANTVHELLEYICLHGYLQRGPTSIKNYAGSERFYLENRKTAEVVKLTYYPHLGNITLTAFSDLTATEEITDFVLKFLELHIS